MADLGGKSRVETSIAIDPGDATKTQPVPLSQLIISDVYGNAQKHPSMKDIKPIDITGETLKDVRAKIDPRVSVSIPELNRSITLSFGQGIPTPADIASEVASEELSARQTLLDLMADLDDEKVNELLEQLRQRDGA